MSTTINSQLLQHLAQSAQQQGFTDGAAISVTGPGDDFINFYQQYLHAGLNADLNYLTRPERRNLLSIFPQAQTLILFLYPYRFRDIEAKLRAAPFKVARYAWQNDYHDMLRRKLKHLLVDCNLNGRAVTDSAPLPERYWGRAAGLGRIGRNGMLISERHGSFFLIASLLVAEPLETAGITRFGAGQVFSDAPVALNDMQQEIASTCADCDLCVTACPTGALTGDGLMDTRACISYQTIESKNANDEMMSTSKKHKWIFGCDICQQVCPYNKGEQSFADSAFNAEHLAAAAVAAAELPEKRSGLKGSVFFRRGLDKLRANIAAVRAVSE